MPQPRSQQDQAPECHADRNSPDAAAKGAKGVIGRGHAFSNPISTAAEMPVAFASVLAVGIVMPAPLMMLCMCPVESPVSSDRRLIEPRPLALIHAASGVSFAFFMPHR